MGDDQVVPIRQAVRLMRERAQAATPGPWTATDAYPHLVLQGDDDMVSTNLAGKPREDAIHIASWTPAVALAVADLLDLIARTSLLADAIRGHPGRNVTAEAALNVAAAYLGTVNDG